METTKLGNSAFTDAVVERTELGRADPLGDVFVTASTLSSHVVHRAKQFTGDQHTPVMGRPLEERSRITSC